MKKLLSFGLIVPLVMALYGCNAPEKPSVQEEGTIELNSIDDGRLPDIEVTELNLIDENGEEIVDPRRGDIVYPRITFENTGEELAQNFTILIEDLTTATGVAEDGSLRFAQVAIDVESIAPDEIQSLTAGRSFFLRPQRSPGNRNFNHEWRVQVDPWDQLVEHSDRNNTFQFFIPLEHNVRQNPDTDFIIRSISKLPENIVRNGAFEIGPNNESEFKIVVQDNDHIVGFSDEEQEADVEIRVGNRTFNETAQLHEGTGEVNFTIRARLFEEGEYEISATIDPHNQVGEYNERNNNFSGKTLRITNNPARGIPWPDLEITNVEYELYNQRGVRLQAEELRRGDIFYPMVTVTNTGNAPIEDEFFYIDMTDSTRIAGINNDGTIRYYESAIRVDALAPGESATETTVSPVVLNPRTGRGDFVLVFEADKYEYITERDNSNNTYRARIPYEHIGWRPITHDFYPERVVRTPHNVVTQDGWEVNLPETLALEINIADNDYVDRGEEIVVENVPVRVEIGDNYSREFNIDMNEPFESIELNVTGNQLGLGQHEVRVTILDNPHNETNVRNNSRVMGNVSVVEFGAADDIGAWPELSLQEIRYQKLTPNGWVNAEPEEIRRGDRFKVFPVVINTGTGESNRFFDVMIEDRSQWMRDPITGEMTGLQTLVDFSEPIGVGQTATNDGISTYIIDNTGRGDFTLRFRVDPYDQIQELNESNNFSVGRIPRENTYGGDDIDLLVTHFQRSPVNIVNGEVYRINESETLRFEVTLKNNDQVNRLERDDRIVDVPVRVQIGDITKNILITTEDRTGSGTGMIEVTGEELGLGVHDVSITVDPENQFAETNEENNVAPGEYNSVEVIEAPDAPNLVPVSARFVEVGENIYYPIVTIRNEGELPIENSFNTIVHNKGRLRGIDRYGEQRYDNEHNWLDGMTAGEEVEIAVERLEITINPNAITDSEVWVQVDNSGFANFDDVDESNETDNEAFYSIRELVEDFARNERGEAVVEDADDQIDRADQGEGNILIDLGGNEDEEEAEVVMPNEEAEEEPEEEIEYEIDPSLVLNLQPREGATRISGRYNRNTHSGFVTIKAFVNGAEAGQMHAFDGTFRVNLESELETNDSVQILLTRNSGHINVTSETYFVEGDEELEEEYEVFEDEEYLEEEPEVFHDEEPEEEIEEEAEVVMPDEEVEKEKPAIKSPFRRDNVKKKRTVKEKEEVKKSPFRKDNVRKKTNKDDAKKRLLEIKKKQDKALSDYRANLRGKGIKIPAEKDKELIKKKSPAHQGASDQGATLDKKPTYAPKFDINPGLRRIKLQSIGEIEVFESWSFWDVLKNSILSLFR